MKISIIIPCYNGSNFIINTLKSVQEQTYQNWECVIVDDGSKDSSKNTIQNFIGSDNRFIYHYQENKGLSGARNTGMEIATGAYIYFLDADDLISTDSLENLQALIDIDIDIVFGKTAITHGQNFNIEGYLDHNLPTLKKIGNNTQQLIPLVVEYNLICTAHNRLYKKQFLQKNNLIFKDGLLHEDELWFFETLFFSDNIILNNKATYFYNVANDDSITNNMSSKNIEAYLTIIEIIYKKYYLTCNYNDEIALYITKLKQVSIHFYNTLLDKDKALVKPSIKQVFDQTKTKRLKKIVSNKIEKRFRKFQVTTLLAEKYFFNYHQKPKTIFNKINRKILFYIALFKNMNS